MHNETIGSHIEYVRKMSLSELQQRKVFLKSLRPQMWGNKDKLHRLNYLIDKVDLEMFKIESKEWKRPVGGWFK